MFLFAILLAEAQIVEKGDKILNLGLGIGNTLYSGSVNTGTFPPNFSFTYFQDNLAAMLELGYGVAYLNIGVALNLGN